MYNSNYILVYRSELLDWTFERGAAFYLWTFIRLKAASQQKMQTVGRRAITVKVDFGQFATSKTYLSLTLNMDDRTIDNILNDLVADGLIEIEDKNIYIIITVKDYDKYCPEIGVLPQTIWSPIPATAIDSLDSSIESQEDTDPLLSNEEESPKEEHSLSNSMVNSMSDSIPQNSPESPIVVEEDKKKENNNNSTSSSTTGGEDFFERLRNSPANLEMVKNQMGIKTMEEMLEILSVFELFITSQEKLHNNYSDFVTHFMNWYPKYKAKKSAKNSAPKHGGGQSVSSEKPSGWHNNLGTDTKAKCAKDYEEPI